MRERLTGAEALAAVLKSRGVSKAFAVVGNQVNDIAIAFENAGIQIVTCRHEGNAALMAEGYARRSRKIGVVLTIPGPGVANALIGVLEAFTACTAVLVITASQPSRSFPLQHDKLFHGLDQIQITKSITNNSGSISSRCDFDLALTKALSTLESGRPRPVLLEFDIPWMRRNDDYDISKFAIESAPPFAVEVAKEIATAIARSKRCIVIAGMGIFSNHAIHSFRSFIERSGIPVLTTTLGKGVISEFDKFYIGKLYEACCNEVIANSDLILAIGVRFTQVDTNDWTLPLGSIPLIHIDSDPHVINNEYKSYISVTADINDALNTLVPLLPENVGARADLNDLREMVQKSRGEAPVIASMLGSLIRNEDALVVDVHEQGYPLMEHLPVFNGNNFLFSGLSLALGYGIPAAIGARFASTEGQVICFCGDGGFLLSSPELATVSHYKLDIFFIVVDDSAYGTIKTNQSANHGISIGVDITNPKFDLLSEAYDFKYFIAGNLKEVSELLNAAYFTKGPRVLVIPKGLLTN